jgi:signal transduction histidine kinase
VKVGSRPGAGLGLTICRAIVQAHGGEIALQNRAGGGALVRFTLPASSRDALSLDAESDARSAGGLH